MPAVSDAQRRFMFAVLSGKIKGTGLTKEQAGDFAHTPGKLPEHMKNGKPMEMMSSGDRKSPGRKKE